MAFPERDIARRLDSLVTQINRIAYTIEQFFLHFDPRETLTCTECQCSIVPKNKNKCPVCGAVMNDVEGGNAAQ